MDRNASSVMFGFDFQANAAIILMLENIKNMRSIRVEGEEDIEIYLNDDTYILAQAKAVVNASTDFRNVRNKAYSALQSLSDACQNKDITQLIFITNSPNPFKDEHSKPMFYGESHVKFNVLPQKTKDLISQCLSQIARPLNTDNLLIQVLPFETDVDKQKYKVVLGRISDFIGELDISYYDGLRKHLHNIWLAMLNRNSSKSDKSIKLSKKDVIWPIIVFVTNKVGLDRTSQYCKELDDSEYEYLVTKYKEIIDDTSEKFDISVKVITDYYQSSISGSDAIQKYVDSKWENFVSEFGLYDNNIDREVSIHLTKIILYNILRKRFEIDKIKKAVKL